MTASTWTAEDLRRPRRWLRAALLVVAMAVAGGLAGGVFLVAGTDRDQTEEHGPGVFGRVAHVDQLPGYRVDDGTRPPRLGPARLEMADGRRVFVPVGTPFTPTQRLCPDLRPLPPGSAPAGTCLVRVALADDARTATWVTPHVAGAAGRATVTAGVRHVGEDRVVLADGTVLPVGQGADLDGCDGPAEAGQRLTLEVDAATGEVDGTRCA